MKAGQTNLEVGTIVQLQNIKGEDKELNGLIGTVTHPFAFGETKKGWVGIWLEAGKTDMSYGGQCNVKASECRVLEKEKVEANAKLIATAPAMLNALFTIRDNNRDVLDGSTVELINSLINKAT